MNILLVAFLFNGVAHAGCPAIGLQNVTAQIRSCKEVLKPDGTLIMVDVERVGGPRLGMDLKSGDKLELFVLPDQKQSCKSIPVGKTFCFDIQQWCPMTGNKPHTANHTAYNFRPKACTAQNN